jgi:small-conductance mechanosensitive channel
VLIARQEQQRPILVLKAIGFSAAASVVLVVVILALVSLTRHVRIRIARASFDGLPRFLGVDLGPVLRGMMTMLMRLPFQVAGVLTIFLWSSFVLAQFPYTRPWSQVLGAESLALLSSFAHAMVAALPDLGTIAVIMILTHLLHRGITAFFRSIEDGVIRVDWLHPESARATRRIAALLVWLFAITLAYPYIPGSGSESFKGISVFAGLVLSLGSAGIVNQVMCGLMVVYARTMRPGDLIQAGTVTGRVSELGFLSTKVRTLALEEVTIPNSVLMGSAITNWSTMGPAGSLISEKLSLGYDVPWRQVHALLHLAAARTEGIEDGANAEVLQQELGDFAVLYEIRCRLRWPEQRFETLSRLRSHLLDVFNEHGVQLMSPHFEGQPDKPVLVPNGQWYRPPAVPPRAVTEDPPLLP